MAEAENDNHKQQKCQDQVLNPRDKITHEQLDVTVIKQIVNETRIFLSLVKKMIVSPGLVLWEGSAIILKKNPRASR